LPQVAGDNIALSMSNRETCESVRDGLAFWRPTKFLGHHICGAEFIIYFPAPPPQWRVRVTRRKSMIVRSPIFHSVAAGHPNQSLRNNSKLKFETKLLFDCFEHAAAY
jgi:hypothetical protein